MEDRTDYLTRLMVQNGVRTFGGLMAIKTPRSDATPPALTWSFAITLEDVGSADPSLVSMCGQMLTNAARERMMREYGFFSGRSQEHTEREIVKLRHLEERCEACGSNIYGDAAGVCLECGGRWATE